MIVSLFLIVIVIAGTRLNRYVITQKKLLEDFIILRKRVIQKILIHKNYNIISHYKLTNTDTTSQQNFLPQTQQISCRQQSLIKFILLHFIHY
ncbi:hypothetical protein pb186bvf_002169 [Paramecium bursaria]